MRRRPIGNPPRDVPNDLPEGAAEILARVGGLRVKAREYLVREYGDDWDYGTLYERLSEALWNVDGYLGMGIGRAAFLLPKGIVLKVAIDDAARPMNRSEARIWSSASREDALHLLPVLAVGADGWWVAMPYCNTDGDRKNIDPQARRRVYDLVGRADVGASDNWCRYQGRLVLLDYGQG